MADDVAPAVILQDQGLEVVFADGRKRYFNAYWLRDNCPTSFDRETRERVFDIFAAAEAPAFERAEIADGALVIAWKGDGHITRHDLAWLAAHGEGGPRADTSALARRAWFHDHYPDIERFAQPALLNDRGLVAKWIEALLIEGIAIVTDMPGTKDALSRTAGLVGGIRPTFWGPFFEVKTHLDPTNLAFTAGALELHTDTPPRNWRRASSSFTVLRTRWRAVTACLSMAWPSPTICGTRTPTTSLC